MFDIILTCNYSPWSSYSGGGQKSTHALANAYSKLGKDVAVIYSKSILETIKPSGNLYKPYWAVFWGIFPGISSPFRFLNGISFYFLVKKISGPHTVIHCNGEEGCFLGLVSQKKRIIYSNRYPKFDEYLKKITWSSNWKWVGLFFREPRLFALRLGFEKSDVIVCTSLYSKLHLSEYMNLPIEKIHVIPNGIDAIFFERIYSENCETSGFFYFGRLTKAKGVIPLLEAYNMLPQKIKEKMPLYISGVGPLEIKIKNRVQELKLQNYVNLLGWKSSRENLNLMLRCRLVILPSLEESFGNTMLETLASGARLITTKEGAIPEVVGDWAKYLTDTKPLSIKTAIERELNNFRNPMMILEQTDYVRNNFSWEKTAQEYLSLME